VLRGNIGRAFVTGQELSTKVHASAEDCVCRGCLQDFSIKVCMLLRKVVCVCVPVYMCKHRCCKKKEHAVNPLLKTEPVVTLQQYASKPVR